MHNHSVLKKLLAVSAVAAMFSAFGVHAQTGGSSSASGTSQDATTQTGKTTREGTAGNTNSRGEQQHQSGSSSSTGSTGSASGSSQGGTSSMSDTTGAGNPNTTGKTTSEGTPGNTNSTGMEKRQGTSGGSSSGSSGSSGSSSGASGTSGASGAAGATGSSSGKLSSGDEKMLKDIAQANINEIAAAKLALSKSQNDQVKSFAQQMIDDHTKGLNDTQQLAQQKGVTLPTEPDTKHKAMTTALEAMSGAAFDKAYMSQAGVSDHKTVHSKLVSDTKKAKDADVKALAQKLEPVVAQHLKSAQQDKASMSGTTSGK